MRWAWAAPLCLWAHVSAAGFGFLELHSFGRGTSGEPGQAALFLAFPDSIGPVPVRPFLEAPEKKARDVLDDGVWKARPLTRSEKEFLLSLRAMAGGRMGEARDRMAAASKNLPRHLQACHRINTALLLYLSGLPAEAEKEWLRSLSESGPVAEGAWRNLYSLYLGRKDFAKAHGLVEAALEEAPKNDWAVAAKGYLLHMLRSDYELEEFLRKKSSWKDSLFTMQIAYGRFLRDREQWEEAAKYYNRGLEGNPHNGNAWMELADSYYRMGYLVFAETCIRHAFKYGVTDAYVFELYGRVLQDLSALADSGRVLVQFGFRLDREWAEEQWRRAEKILEAGLPHDVHSRSMAQLLYRLYCGNGKVQASRNLREDFWFHFKSPYPPAKPPRLGPAWPDPSPHLFWRLSYVTYPYVSRLQFTDFYEPF